MVEQSRLLISLQVASGPVSGVLIAILVFWTAALFFGIGLYAEPNALAHLIHEGSFLRLASVA